MGYQIVTHDTGAAWVEEGVVTFISLQHATFQAEANSLVDLQRILKNQVKANRISHAWARQIRILWAKLSKLGLLRLPLPLAVGDKVKMDDTTWGVLLVLHSPFPTHKGWHALAVEARAPTPSRPLRRKWVPLQ